jgi:hypothetical protein
MSDIIDINVNETIEEVTINVTDNLITVNINKVTGGGGGTQTLAQTLDLGNTTGGENISISNGDAIILDNGSMLKKGTTDAGNGGLGGIAQICGLGYEHKWEAGRLYIMNSSGNIIREVSHNFTEVPTATDDVTKGFVQNTRWILDNGDVYLCTDPTEDAAVWELVNTGITPTLQEVTDEGNVSSNDIQVTLGSSSAYLRSDSLKVDDGTPNSIVVTGNKIVFTKTEQLDLTTPTFTAPRTQTFQNASGTLALLSDIPTAGVTSVGLTMPSAFSVTNSPITSSGDIAVTGAGTASQYVRGDGQLATFPSGGGGGSSVNYYLNGSIAASVATYQQMSNTAIIGAGTDFTKTGNGLIAQFLTDIGNPNRLEIPGGAWNFEMFFSMSSGGGSPKFYVELLKYDGATFTSIASSSAIPETISGGTIIDLYLTSLAVPTTALLVTDRLAIRVYIVDSTGGRTATLHTENSHLCEIITTFSGGVTSLNGLTANTQYFDEGTTGTDFNISSTTDTHTFNLPTASASNRGALSSTDWSTFNGKQNALGFTAENVTNKENTTLDTSTTKYPTNRLTKEYADAKVTDAITDGVTTIAPSQNAVFDALALKQAALSYTPYRNVQTSQTAITTTVAETIVFTATIPAGSFNSVDVLKILYGANKTTSLGAYTLRLRVNTTNTLSGAPTIASYIGSVSSQVNVLMRNLHLNGGNLYGLGGSTSSLTDIVVSGSSLGSNALNPANTFYLFATVQLTNVLDSIVGNMFTIHN